MITPNQARELAKSSGDKRQHELERYEGFIQDAAEIGKSGALLDYTDCVTENRVAAMHALKERGFRIEIIRVGSEAPAYYVFW